MNTSKVFRLAGWLALVLLTTCAAPSFGDSYTFDFENPSSNLVYNGSAVATTNSSPYEINGQPSGQLTNNTPNYTVGSDNKDAGSIILATPIDTTNFNVSFSFLLTGTSTYPGDGITLAIFGGTSPDVVGKCCSGLGFADAVSEVVPAFAVEFDTVGHGKLDNVDQGGSGCIDPITLILYPNGCPDDTLGAHIAVTLGSEGIFSTLRDQGLQPEPLSLLTNQVDTADVQLSNDLLNVTLNGVPVITGYQVPLAFIPDMGYIGFTGSSDGATDYQIVGDATVTTVPEPSAISLFLMGILIVALANRRLKAQFPRLAVRRD